MRFVDRPVNRPHTCAVIPGRGATEKEGFIDTHNELPGWDPAVYVSMAGAREIARFIGWLDPEAEAALREEIQIANDRIAELEQELAEADQFQSNIDGLTKHGFMVKRAPGRPSIRKAA